MAIAESFAAVGIKGAEAVLVYRRGVRNEWSFAQLLKSSDYSDDTYPENGTL